MKRKRLARPLRGAQRLRRKQAFTLIELMVVLVILGILAVTIVPNVVGRSDKAKFTKAQADIAVIEGLLDQFYLDMGRYPTTEEGLRVLFYEPEEEVEKWGGPYSKKPIGNDPWGNAYIYEAPGTRSSLSLAYELMSLGKDGQEGGEGYDADITSWPEEEGEE
jgi:general secretion pathway protein G